MRSRFWRRPIRAWWPMATVVWPRSRRSTMPGELTAIGRTLARLPIDVQLARMLVEGEQLHALREMLTIVSFLSIQDPRERPSDARQQADAAHAVFADPKSDFVGVLNLWRAYHDVHEELTQSKLRDWCSRHFLSFMRMREWRELHRQLLVVVKELGWKLDAAAEIATVGERALPARAADAGGSTSRSGRRRRSGRKPPRPPGRWRRRKTSMAPRGPIRVEPRLILPRLPTRSIRPCIAVCWPDFRPRSGARTTRGSTRARASASSTCFPARRCRSRRRTGFFPHRFSTSADASGA